jgi:hypothetical protein
MDYLDLVQAVINEYYDQSTQPTWPRPSGSMIRLNDGTRCPVKSAGVYIFLTEEWDRILYVGKADRLDRRLNVGYFRDFAPHAAAGPFWGGFEAWELKPLWMYLVKYESAQFHEASGLERFLLRELDPKENKRGRLSEREKERLRPSVGGWWEMRDGRLAFNQGYTLGDEKGPFQCPNVEGWLSKGFRWSRPVRE